jgi:hypothetical protein
MLMVAGLGAHSAFTQDFESKAQAAHKAQAAQMEEKRLSPACLQWHQAASAVVGRLAESTRDSDLRQIHDAVFRLRRARRNCEAGWLTLACQDYHAVARSLPGRINIHDESLFACRRSAETGGFTTIP